MNPDTQNHEDDGKPENHPFVDAPNTTLVRYSIPVLFSLVAEPLTGLVDTAFVATLGSDALAALGVGAAVLSSIFWIFNFLNIGTQTEVAQAMGQKNQARVRQVAGLSLVMAFIFGSAIIVAVTFLSDTLIRAMGGSGPVHLNGVLYTDIRLYGAPAVLISFAGFGFMRGRQDMATPLWIAGGINVLNIALDPLCIFGMGPFPAMGVAGAALASVISQWIGALFCVMYIIKESGLPRRLEMSRAIDLLRVGGDLFIRTGMLTLFLLLTTRAATAMGPASGAAHQAIRQAWILAAFIMDAYAISGQSLVAYFMGSGLVYQARRVASVVCWWSLGTGGAIALLMIAGKTGIIRLLVPTDAVPLFTGAWLVCALMQPLSALAFATDGIHWGTGDFKYLRNAVVLATVTAGMLLTLLDGFAMLTLERVWFITVLWVLIRATAGIFRIWPGTGHAPLAAAPSST